MRIWVMMLLVLSVVVTGCSKKNEGGIASPTAGVTVQPSPGASATPNGTSSPTTGGTATATPKAGDNATKDEPLPKITKEQADKISMTGTYDDVVKLTGSKGKLVKDENGKKTYEFEISNQPGYYVQLVFFADGKISEKRVYQK
ncbi:hypothetical protein [Paenibacillus sp. Soil724D2]|uniref:hypothetical protein n=1 Tax=Paenibacillus sp. (strain Soil724D2) TaxID=1736392 RepID=UPI000713ECF4|nr:hypothetical protein [Paenibacillus sp. Soil724D2]KRE51472.1 hypothetical protein ASG85_18280 [Paenibacillus sp. Soil724D2]